jgi:acetylornithine/succinyldiaminopimelate/putrescine aminotransferase
MIGIDFTSHARDIQKYLFDWHIITNVTAGEVLRLLPPLIFERKHSEELAHAIAEAVEHIASEHITPPPSAPHSIAPAHATL